MSTACAKAPLPARASTHEEPPTSPTTGPAKQPFGVYINIVGISPDAATLDAASGGRFELPDGVSVARRKDRLAENARDEHRAAWFVEECLFMASLMFAMGQWALSSLHLAAVPTATKPRHAAQRAGRVLRQLVARAFAAHRASNNIVLAGLVDNIETALKAGGAFRGIHVHTCKASVLYDVLVQALSIPIPPNKRVPACDLLFEDAGLEQAVTEARDALDAFYVLVDETAQTLD